MSDVNRGLGTNLTNAHNEHVHPQKSDAASFAKVMATTGPALAATARLASPLTPRGTAVVSGALTGVGTLRSSNSALSTAANGVTDLTDLTVTLGEGATALPGYGGIGSFGGGAFDAIATRAQSGDASAQMMMATRQMQELNQQFNLQYLTLQQKIQGENRQYTALSNVMKSKHDTAKNALNNLK